MQPSSSSSSPMQPSSSSSSSSSYRANKQLFGLPSEYQRVEDSQTLAYSFDRLSVFDSHQYSLYDNRLNNRSSLHHHGVMNGGGGSSSSLPPTNTRRETMAEPSQQQINNHYLQRLSFKNDSVNGLYGYNVGQASDPLVINGYLGEVPYLSRNRFSDQSYWSGINDSFRRSNGGLAHDRNLVQENAMGTLANDRISCNQLQKKIAEGSRETIDSIFNDVIFHVCEMMMDPFGHHVIEKLMEKCSSDQITQILDLVTRQKFFVSICTDPLGTRSIQSLFGCLHSKDQIMRIVEAIRDAALILTRSNNASHVVLQCFNKFSPSQNRDLLEVIVRNCYRIAIDEHGCCMLQKCLAIGCDVLKQRLINEIIANAVKLCANCYGNYVVQYIVELEDGHVIERLMGQLSGHYAYLSRNKYGSHVVQKLLKIKDLDSRFIVFDLLRDIDPLLVDPYGNYVIQTAWFVSKDDLRQILLYHIRHNTQLMRYNMFGRKILEKLRLLRFDW